MPRPLLLILLALADVPAAAMTCHERVASHGEPPRLEEVVAIFRSKCASCHRGPYLDYSTFPFQSDSAPSLAALLGESYRRMELTDWRRMPPVNAPGLTADERAVLAAWRDAGFPLEP